MANLGMIIALYMLLEIFLKIINMMYESCFKITRKSDRWNTNLELWQSKPSDKWELHSYKLGYTPEIVPRKE